MSRPRRTKYGYPSEPQYGTEAGWVVARHRPHQHGYELLHRGQLVGWLSRAEDGWRWHLWWSPGSGSRPPRFGIDRVSTRAYPSWQMAAGQLARTDVGRRISGGAHLAPKAAEWKQSYRVQGQPWTPRPATHVEAVSS